MAGYDRWMSDRDRYRRGGERDHNRERERFAEQDRFNRYDRESFARGEEGFGRGSRDYPGGREYHSYGHDRGSMGRRDEPGRDWDSDYRSGYGRRDYAGEREPGRGGYRERSRGQWQDRDHGGHPEHGRSVSDMAFGRDQSGRDDPAGFGRQDDRDRGGWFDRVGDEIASWFGGDHDEERIRRLDLREGSGAGQHRGRGPKSYQRSDERIMEDINDRLTDDPQLDASDIEVSVSGREVTLTGTVASRYDKRRAEDLADSVSGVIHVQNNLRVRTQASGASWSDERVGGSTDVTGVGSAGNAGTLGRSDKSTV